MAVRYVTTGQAPDYRIEVRGPIAEVLQATANPGAYACPEDVTGTYLEMGTDGQWTGPSVGTLTQAQADALNASGAMATVKLGTPSTVNGSPVVWRGQGAGGWVNAETLEKYAYGASAIPFKDATVFPRFSSGFDSYRKAETNAYITFIGESTIQGVGSSDFEPNIGSIPNLFAQRMRDSFGISISKYVLPPTAQDNNSAWTLGAGWVKSGFGVCRRACIECPAGVTTTVTFYDPNCGIEWDTITLQFLTFSGGGTFSAQATGGASVPGSCSGSATNAVATITCTASKKSRYNTLTITPDAGQNIRIIGVKYASSDSNFTVCISNAGVGGSRADDLASTVNGLSSNSIPALLESNRFPRLTFICIGVNDAIVNTALNTYLASMQSIINSIGGYSDIVLMSPFRCDSSLTTINDRIAAYETGMASLTGVHKFIPMYTLMGKTYIERRTDNVHPTRHGYKTISDILWNEMTR